MSHDPVKARRDSTNGSHHPTGWLRSQRVAILDVGNHGAAQRRLKQRSIHPVVRPGLGAVEDCGWFVHEDSLEAGISDCTH